MRALAELERLKAEYGGDAAAKKRALLKSLARATLASAPQVLRLHEALVFLRAYPDDAALSADVERMLAAFATRRDLARHRRALADSGVAGTEIRYPFFAETAHWLARRWPERITLDWGEFDAERLEPALPLLALHPESPGLDERDLGVRGWIDRMRGRDTDAAFLVRRFFAVPMGEFARETYYDAMDPTIRLAPGPDTPSRTLQAARVPRIAYRTAPLRRDRPDLFRAARLRPRAVRELRGRDARAMIDLARGTLVTRGRDLDAFAYASERDVRVLDWEDGLQIAFLGVQPWRRLMLEAVYGLLMLENGVPIGYLAQSALLGSAEIAFNVFETFRGAEAAHLFARVLASVRHLFRADTFTLDPYQLGEDNDEAIRSGAWWFYQKLGLRSRDPSVLRLMGRELRRMRGNPRHRSSVGTLKRLASSNVFLELGRRRPDVLGEFDLGGVGLAVTDFLARSFGADRDRAERELSRDAARRLGVRSFRGWSADERLWWARWAPLVAVLPGIGRWSAADRRALAGVIRAKGGARESEFVLRFDRHGTLRRALGTLARKGGVR